MSSLSKLIELVEKYSMPPTVSPDAADFERLTQAYRQRNYPVAKPRSEKWSGKPHADYYDSLRFTGDNIGLLGKQPALSSPHYTGSSAKITSLNPDYMSADEWPYFGLWTSDNKDVAKTYGDHLAAVDFNIPGSDIAKVNLHGNHGNFPKKDELIDSFFSSPYKQLQLLNMRDAGNAGVSSYTKPSNVLLTKPTAFDLVKLLNSYCQGGMVA